MARATITRKVSVSAVGSTTLAVAAAGLTARRFVQFTNTWPGGSGATWKIPGANETILAYANSGCWDPVRRKALFHGAGYVASRLVQYDEASNTWSYTDPNPPGNIIHIWDHAAIDTSRGHFYVSDQLGGSYYRYNIAAGTWSTLAGHAAYETHGVTWFPEIDSLISVPRESDNIFRFAAGGSSWSTWVSGTGYATNYHGFAEYDPIRGQVYFGGGSNNSRALYKVTSAGVVTRLADAPANILDLGGSGSNICCDPVSGRLVVRAKVSGAMYEYNPDTNAWASISTTGSSGLPLTSVAMCIPISTHGIIMYVAAADTQGGGAVCALYRHT